MSLPQTTFEQRKANYDDVETLLSYGFLPHPVRVHGGMFNLRSLSSGDMFLLRSRVGFGLAEDWRLWMIASSIWMVDGISLLEETHSAVRMMTSLRRLPRSVRDILYSVVLGLFNRQQQAQEGAEAYSYEILSRYHWSSYGCKWLEKASGVPGAERLGLNAVQSTWIALNVFQDQKEQRDLIWESAKLVASAQSPKGVKKLDQHDKDTAEREKGRRQQVMDRFFYYRKGLVDVEGRSPDGGKAYEVGPKTVEQLEDEMKRWVTGEYDWHDAVVAEYKHQAGVRMKAEEDARIHRLEALQRESVRRERELPTVTTPLVGYKAEDLQRILRDRQQGPVGARRVHINEKDRQWHYERYLAQPESPGLLQESGGRLVEVQPESELDRQLADRQVPFTTRKED